MLLVVAGGLLLSGCDGNAAAPMPALAAACLGCHGPGGHSSGAIPDLAGMPQADFVRSMAAFRRGAGTVMGRIVPAYSEADVEQMAAYFSALEPSP